MRELRRTKWSIPNVKKKEKWTTFEIWFKPKTFEIEKLGLFLFAFPFSLLFVLSYIGLDKETTKFQKDSSGFNMNSQ